MHQPMLQFQMPVQVRVHQRGDVCLTAWAGTTGPSITNASSPQALISTAKRSRMLFLSVTRYVWSLMCGVLPLGGPE